MNDSAPAPDEALLVRQEGAIAVLTLNRPAARNALDAALLEAVSGALARLRAQSDVRAVVITGAGERAFSAGADIRHMQAMDAGAARKWADLGHEVFQALEDLPLPTIAAINGAALGGGCELALACDFRWLAEGAVLGQPEIKLGIMPGWGGTQRLPRLVGPALAKELIFTGRSIGGEEALRAGLAHAVVPQASLLAETLAFAEQFAHLPPVALAYAKRAIAVASLLPPPEAQGVEKTLFTRCFDTDDREEGFAAFLEKRAPRFRGR